MCKSLNATETEQLYRNFCSRCPKCRTESVTAYSLQITTWCYGFNDVDFNGVNFRLGSKLSWHYKNKKRHWSDNFVIPEACPFSLEMLIQEDKHED